MTKKHFLKRVNNFREHLIILNYNTLTCHKITGYFGTAAYMYYKHFIRKFLDSNGFILRAYRDDSGYPMLIRCMLTEAFFEECLQTGKYKEF